MPRSVRDMNSETTIETEAPTETAMLAEPAATGVPAAPAAPTAPAGQPLRGLSTVTFYADDVSAAQRWYTEFLGVEPYFFNPPQPAAPVYVEFRLGDLQHELGIVDRRFAPAGEAGAESGADAGVRTGAGAGQPITYWHVDEVEEVFARLLALGATLHEELTERGPGFVTASVVDPFGNVLGIMFNRHFLDVLGGRSGDRAH